MNSFVSPIEEVILAEERTTEEEKMHIIEGERDICLTPDTKSNKKNSQTFVFLAFTARRRAAAKRKKLKNMHSKSTDEEDEDEDDEEEEGNAMCAVRVTFLG